MERPAGPSLRSGTTWSQGELGCGAIHKQRSYQDRASGGELGQGVPHDYRSIRFGGPLGQLHAIALRKRLQHKDFHPPAIFPEQEDGNLACKNLCLSFRPVKGSSPKTVRTFYFHVLCR